MKHVSPLKTMLLLTVAALTSCDQDANSFKGSELEEEAKHGNVLSQIIIDNAKDDDFTFKVTTYPPLNDIMEEYLRTGEGVKAGGHDSIRYTFVNNRIFTVSGFKDGDLLNSCGYDDNGNRIPFVVNGVLQSKPPKLFPYIIPL